MIRLSDHDYLSRPTDAPANTRWEGRIDPAGITLISALSAWYMGGSQPLQAEVATVRILNGDGMLDAAALSGLAGSPVAIELVDHEGAYAHRLPLARLVVDKFLPLGDGSLQLSLRDAHNDLDAVINTGVFDDTVASLGGRTQPMLIGAVSNAPVLLTGSDGSVGWIADAPVHVARVRDRGDPMEPGTWSMGLNNQQIRLESPPVGPMTSDASSIGLDIDGEPVPATLQQALAEVFRRDGKTAWNPAGAAAIDAATDYAGVGLYAADARAVRVALKQVLDSYGAALYQRADGVIEVARLEAPEMYAGALAFDLAASDIGGEVTYETDAAPALRRRIAYRPNGRIMRESELVTDLVDVPPALRQSLGQPYAGVVTASGALPAEYAHADDAEPFVSLLWREQDAQAEADRLRAMYGGAGPRRTYRIPIRGDQEFVVKPGAVGRIRYPRHGLELGRLVQVVRVEHNPSRGDTTMYCWGA